MLGFMDTQLFPGMEVETVVGHAEAPPGDRSGPPRLRRPDRGQWLMGPPCLEELVPPDHQSPIVWGLVERLALSGFYDAIRAAGRKAGVSPANIATSSLPCSKASVAALGSARELE